MATTRAGVRFVGGFAPAVALALGPTTEGVTPNVASTPWVLWIETNQFRLDKAAQATASSPPPSYLSSFDASAVNRVSLAFNQNARRVIAWEVSGQITVSSILPGPPETESQATFPGLDPVMLWDGILIGENGDATDIILFHLSANRQQIIYRLQSESYGVAHNWVALPTACTLEMVGISSAAIVLRLTGSNGTDYAVVTDLYPIRVTETMNTAFSISELSILRPVLVPIEPLSDAVNAGFAATGGELFGVLGFDAITDTALHSFSVPSGFVYAVGQLFDVVSEALTQSFLISGGENMLTIVLGGQYDEALTASLAVPGGDYVLRITSADPVPTELLNHSFSVVAPSALINSDRILEPITEQANFSFAASSGQLVAAATFDSTSEQVAVSFSLPSGALTLGVISPVFYDANRYFDTDINFGSAEANTNLEWWNDIGGGV